MFTFKCLRSCFSQKKNHSFVFLCLWLCRNLFYKLMKWQLVHNEWRHLVVIDDAMDLQDHSSSLTNRLKTTLLSCNWLYNVQIIPRSFNLSILSFFSVVPRHIVFIFSSELREPVVKLRQHRKLQSLEIHP